jgi:capsid assembly protease
MINLPFVASRVFGTPLMIARAKLEVILGVLGPRFAGAGISPADAGDDSPPLTATTSGGIAVISVVGTLVSRSGYLDASSGLLSYGDIGDAITVAMDDPNVHGVMLDLDSPGGEVGGLFDLVDQIGAVKTAAGKPLWAVANESALSAAYAIASTVDRLYVTRTGEIGSIGVVAVHVDESGADAKAGLSWSFLFAGDQKIDGNAHEPLSGRARATIQADVDRLYLHFCSLVAANRGLTTETVRATNAAIYRGELAVRAGLADRVGTLAAAIADMAAELDDAAQPRHATINPTIKRSPSMATSESEPTPRDAEEVHTAAATQPAVPPAAANAEPAPAPVPTQPAAPACEPVDADAVQLPGDPAKRLREEYAEIAELAVQAMRLGVSIDAADALRRGISAADLRRSVLDTLAARAEASSVIAAAPSTPTAGDSPIVRRARERAAERA